jgi:ABC-type sugar transport system ATPase subunit
MSEVKIDKLCKSFGPVEVLKDIDLTVEDGSFVVLVGPSGCGKSTLLRSIAGLEPVSSGSMTIGGKTVNDLPPAQREIAMVFQSYALYPHMDVYSNMAFGLKFAKTPKAEIDARVSEAARILQLEPLLKRRPRELSGGQPSAAPLCASPRCSYLMSPCPTWMRLCASIPVSKSPSCTKC